MKKLFILALVAVAVSGCAVKYQTPRGSSTHVFWQRGIMLMVTHTCTDHGKVYQAGRGLVADIIGAEPVNIPLDPAPIGSREIQVTLQSLDQNGNAKFVFVERFQIDYYSTTSQTWTISDSGWSGGGRQARCPR